MRATEPRRVASVVRGLMGATRLSDVEPEYDAFVREAA